VKILRHESSEHAIESVIKGTAFGMARYWPTTCAGFRASGGGYTMWISFFTVALVIAIGLGTASLFIEANTKAPRRLVRRRVFRSRG
jgi:hypothetical protein